VPHQKFLQQTTKSFRHRPPNHRMGVSCRAFMSAFLEDLILAPAKSPSINRFQYPSLNPQQPAGTCRSIGGPQSARAARTDNLASSADPALRSDRGAFRACRIYRPYLCHQPVSTNVRKTRFQGTAWLTPRDNNKLWALWFQAHDLI